MYIEEIKKFKNIRSNNLVPKLISYFEKELGGFVYSSEYKNILIKKRNENQHTLSLCTYLTNKCKSKYYFARENAQKGCAAIDIGVYRGSVLIFTIEAKLFPIPKGTKENPRNEYEYVYGHGGGIQRFKDGNHGRDNEDHYFKENGLIGYIKENNFDFWFAKVNQWIIDAKWDENEKLKKIGFDTIAELKSIHKRNDTKEELILFHFWLNVP